MLNAVMLAWYSAGDSAIGNVFYQMEQIGMFTYLLPFLLIFAIVYGVLTKIGIFNDKTINAVIGLAVSLIAVSFEMVPQFFAEIFPRLGIGVGVLIAVFILIGLFLHSGDNADATKWIIFGVGALITIVVFWQTASSLGWGFGWWFEEYWPALAVGIFVIVVISAIVGAGKTPDDKSKIKYAPYWQGPPK